MFLKDCVQSKGEKFKSVVPMLLEDKYGSKARNGNLTLDRYKRMKSVVSSEGGILHRIHFIT